MKAGTITAKLRDAVQVRFFEDGAERIRFKNIEIPDALKELEIRDFAFDVPTDGSSKITFQLFFDDGILPTEFPPARPRVTRAEKAAMKAAAQETEEQPIPEAELVQLPSAEMGDEPAEETPDEPADMELRFNVQGKDRKALVDTMHEILGEEFKYVPGNICGYVGGGYTIDKDGTVTGAYNAELIKALEERGYSE
ncbi:MAG: hypothetical protein LBL82_00855 [Oscillospiraceae bacterium]|jgi:hypothetical protein|nr:hypothetical protein [Oscillospiraceae bacterium]